ncbi:hotdog domain-containing protein [Psychromonas sp. MME2]|uniref:PaaI family thioesterase n=1 Tax=unclassified Psychromonas TaxID=2614957 RepID=UPI00339CE8C9
MSKSKNRLLKMLQSHYPNLKNDDLMPINKNASHKHCMLCGLQNPLGLKLAFFYTADQKVWSHAMGEFHHQGYTGILHGGFLAALLDAAMCQAIFNQGIEAVTAEIKIRYLHEVPANSQVLISAKVLPSRHPLYNVEAQLYVQNKLMVKSSARFMDKLFAKPKHE